ncbi:hypothetical protein V6N13_122087 [Hibiscus sabdariffa]
MANVDMAVVDVRQREVGELSNRKFTHRLAASQDLVLRLDVSKKLEKNYVKTVSFNADGNILVSSSVDKQIMLWDWETGIPKLTFESGHGNLCTGFRAKIMPYTDDRSLITCGGDGQRNASDLAFEPGSPRLIYTCGEDGLVQHIDLRTTTATELIRCQPIGGCSVRNPVIPLYDIAIDPRNPNFFAVVGLDQYARLYDIRVSFLAHTETIQFISLHRIWDWGTIQFHLLHPLHVVQQLGKATPQVYKGHRKKETVNSVSFFGPKSELWLVDPVMVEYTFGRRKAENLFVLRKNMYSGSIVSNLIHIPQFWPAVEPRASRYGLQMLLIRLSYLQQKPNKTNRYILS